MAAKTRSADTLLTLAQQSSQGPRRKYLGETAQGRERISRGTPRMTYLSPGGSCKVCCTVTRHWIHIAAMLTGLALSPVARAQAPINPYNQQAIKVEREFASADTLHAAALLPRIEALRELVDDPAAVSDFLAQAATDPARDPLLRDLALHYVAENLVHQGRLAEAGNTLRTLGTVRDWSLVGPFTAERADITQYDPAASFTDSAGHALRWHAAPSFGAREYLDLGKLFPAASVVYAATSVYSDSARDIALRCGGDGTVSVRVNAQELPSDVSTSAYAFDQRSVGVHLQAGWNSVLVKLTRTSAQWRFSLRITAPAGGGLQLVTSSSRTSEPPLSAAAANVPVSDLATEAVRASSADSAESLEVLGQIEGLFVRGSQMEHLQAAARLAPSAERFLAIAGACKNAGCNFQALNSALRLDGSNPQALTELGGYYAARGQSQKSRELLRQAVQVAPNDFVARAKLAALYADAGLKSTAEMETAWLEKQFPAPLWLKRNLASQYAKAGELEHALRLAKSLDFDGDQSLLADIYQKQHNAADLRNCYERMAQVTPADPDLREKLAELQAGAGDGEAAIAGLREAAVMAPADAGIHRRLGEALLAAGRRQDSRTELATALQLDPSLEGVRQQLQLLGGTTEPLTADAPFMMNAANLAADAHRQAPRDDAPVVTLSDVRLDHVFPNGLNSMRVQEVFYIATSQGAKDFATRSIQYEPTSQQLHMIAARAYKPDGRVVEADDDGDSSVADTSVAMYYDSRSHRVRFPGLAAGDVVELDYRLAPATNINPYGDYFGDLVVFRSSRPIKFRRYAVITPAARSFNVASERMPSPPQISTSGDERTYVWEARDQAPLPSEPRGPSMTEVSPYVNVSTFGSWQQLGQWYANLIAPQFALDDALRQELTKLTAGATTDLEKINAIHQFVLRNTHYVALEFGIYSYKPYPVTQTFERRFGDCKDTASLMIALLRAAGIHADMALVRTRRLGDIDAGATSISVFDHAIVYLPDQNLWLDGTAEYAGSRELPLDDQGAMALTVAANGDAELRRIPVTLPMENYTHRRVQARVEADGQIRFTGSAYTRGEDAPGLRRQFEMPEQQRESVRNNLAEVFPSVKVDAVQVEGANDLEHDITVNFSGELDTFSGRRVLSLSSSWMPRAYVQSLASLSSRRQDLVLPAPWTTEEEIHFALPANATVEALPKTRTIATPFGSALLKYEVRGSEVVITTSVQFRQWRISAGDYEAFRDFCSQVESAFRSDVKVELKG